MTLKMSTAQVVETSVTVTNSSFQNYTHPDDRTTRTTVKNILEYSDDYSRSVAKNSFWYLDTEDTTANTNTGFEARRLLTKASTDAVVAQGGQNVNVIISLNRYSFFEELEGKMLVPMQLQFNIEIANDDELIWGPDTHRTCCY